MAGLDRAACEVSFPRVLYHAGLPVRAIELYISGDVVANCSITVSTVALIGASLGE